MIWAVAVLMEGLLAAVSVGCFIAFLEIFVFLWRPDGPPVAFLVPAMFLYGALAAMIALAIALGLFVSAAVRRGAKPSPERARRLFLSILVPLFLFMIAGGHV